MFSDRCIYFRSQQKNLSHIVWFPFYESKLYKGVHNKGEHNKHENLIAIWNELIKRVNPKS
jgi:hypothetical protein